MIDDDDGLQGGFVNDGTDEDLDGSTSTESIPLSSIPRALQILDLPPDDEEILSVFRNAASGWGTEVDGPQYVSHKDWRSVCAALLFVETEQASAAPDSSSPGGFLPEEDEDSGEEWDKDIQESSDPDDDDEYTLESQPKASTSKRKGKARRAQPTSSVISDKEDEEEPAGPTARQQRESRRAFALFFPDVAEKDLDSQQIRIKDIDRVAKMLNEKLKADDVSSPIANDITFSQRSCSRLSKCSSTFPQLQTKVSASMISKR